jgi:NAD(P)-dependent dehydrogenase (short-subunit alcohol dehydrogenase family)
MTSVGGVAGTRIVVTGGSSGIGLELARLAIEAGAGEVILAGRSAQRLAAAAQSLGGACTTLVLDVTDESAVAQAFAALGPFDHLVTAAAGTYRGTVVELDTAKARELFESKFWGQHHCVKHGGPQVLDTGSITLFSGWISRKPMMGTGTLAAVDGAIEALGRVLALELAPVRVNTVVPGMIDTPLWSARLTPEQRREHFSKVAQSLPVGRAGTAVDVAHAVLFLMTNGFTTGAVLDVDGGQGTRFN